MTRTFAAPNLFTRDELAAWLDRYVVPNAIYGDVIVRRVPGHSRISVLLTLDAARRQRQQAAGEATS